MQSAKESDVATRWQIEPVNWNSPTAEYLKAIRLQVFVEEQGFSQEEEFDQFDEEAYHVLALDPQGKPCGTGRLYRDLLHPGSARIGRMAVLSQARRTGCGRAIVRHLIAEAKKRGFRRIVLSAQEHAIGFYQRQGFTPTGPHYLDTHVLHQDMVLYL
ncbi:MAG: GNAT family N-acetyltransferase [Candidatus Sumerlaeaceae bacterium]|jgi:predicted GNAT family N-acyltransferase